jgi:predicted RNase H-like nuclease
MVEPTDIEKKSLEAHVELCAQRYNALEKCIKDVKDDVTEMKDVIGEVRDIVHAMSEKRTDQLLYWGGAIIGTLVAAVAYLGAHYVIR